GDEGSGYDIGLRGIRRALLSKDGRRPPTALTGAACLYFDVPSIGYVVGKLSRPRIQQPLIAGFAAMVSEAANAGDEAAIEIIIDAGKALGELAAFVAGRVFEREDTFPVVLAGGVFNAGDLLIDPLKAVMAPQFPKAEFTIAKMSPGEAVARLVRRMNLA
ncbi:MAG: BadF/BadG/BcrA/BcrD ATPase family protein, partial [Armatimonadota bacterium]